MKNFRFSILGVVVLMAVFGALASAQATRTWVSGVGDDANPCSRTAPCKTFAGAISKTAPAGEIDCLDPGGFGALTITKAITIDCDAGVGGASVLVSGTNGIVIAAGAGDMVQLRNMGFMGLNASPAAIRVNSAGTVHLEQVVAYEFTAGCVDVETSGTTVVTIQDSTFENCGSDGVKLNAASGQTVVADLHNVRIYNSGNGLNGANGSRVSVRDSVISFNNPGINQTGLVANGSVIMVQGSTFSLNGTAAVQSSGGGQITACGNVFAGNTLIFNTAGGTITSCGDNDHIPSDPQGSAPGPAAHI